MDPLSVATGCIALITAAIQTTTAVTSFVRGCRDARADLAGVTRELSELQIILELLKEDSTTATDAGIPEALRTQITDILSSCNGIVLRINAVLKAHGGRSGAMRWAASGKNEIAGLRTSLEAYRGSLNLALELMTLTMAKAIKQDTTVIRADVSGLQHGLHGIQDGLNLVQADTSQIPHILEQLDTLRTALGANSDPKISGQAYILEQYLDGLATYAETVVNDGDWSNEGSETDSSQSASSAEEPAGEQSPHRNLEASTDSHPDGISMPPTRVITSEATTSSSPPSPNRHFELSPWSPPRQMISKTPTAGFQHDWQAINSAKYTSKTLKIYVVGDMRSQDIVQNIVDHNKGPVLGFLHANHYYIPSLKATGVISSGADRAVEIRAQGIELRASEPTKYDSHWKADIIVYCAQKLPNRFELADLKLALRQLRSDVPKILVQCSRRSSDKGAMLRAMFWPNIPTDWENQLCQKLKPQSVLPYSEHSKSISREHAKKIFSCAVDLASKMAEEVLPVTNNTNDRQPLN